ncbi:hypothetical protein BCV72DRAFT_332227 [Rhizopus microsporus var. microsporus]|uniref:Uncharacterized protein n=1 Tax=Rhizopus microsporus var. microsporus TaxID=86635 RepID=A0A1X0RH48_RHIZD|nr:hypothetical protein BCV72DRAFT_332227 [Rhizopus microsporus var. microsporus]
MYSALNGIFFISKKNNKYGIDKEAYEQIINELETKFAPSFDEAQVDYFQIGHLRKVYKTAMKGARLARKMAFDMAFDLTADSRKQLEAMMSEAVANMIRELESVCGSHHLEDKFRARFVTPLLSAFFKETKHFAYFGSDEEALGSKTRKGGLGRKSNGGYKVIYNDYEQQIIHVEVKGPKIVTEDHIYHPDFTKLCNLLKDEIDHLLWKDCPTEIPVFGMLISEHKASVYAMDLVYTHTYRLFEIGEFLIPHSNLDLSRLDQCFNVLITLKELVDKSSKQCLEFLMKAATPGTPPARRQLYVKSFRSPQKKSE